MTKVSIEIVLRKPPAGGLTLQRPGSKKTDSFTQSPWSMSEEGGDIDDMFYYDGVNEFNQHYSNMVRALLTHVVAQVLAQSKRFVGARFKMDFDYNALSMIERGRCCTTAPNKGFDYSVIFDSELFIVTKMTFKEAASEEQELLKEIAAIGLQTRFRRDAISRVIGQDSDVSPGSLASFIRDAEQEFLGSYKTCRQMLRDKEFSEFLCERDRLPQVAFLNQHILRRAEKIRFFSDISAAKNSTGFYSVNLAARFLSGVVMDCAGIEEMDVDIRPLDRCVNTYGLSLELASVVNRRLQELLQTKQSFIVRHDREEENRKFKICLPFNCLRYETIRRINSELAAKYTEREASGKLVFHSPVTEVGDAHDELMARVEKLSEAIHAKAKRLLMEALEERNYARALRRLCTSAKEDKMPLIKLLLNFSLKLKYDINVQAGEEQYAAIHYAASRGNKELFDLLCEYGADPKLEDAHGMTAQILLDEKLAQQASGSSQSFKGRVR